MSREDKYLLGCIFAIDRFIEKGSSDYAVRVDGKWELVSWVEIREWIEKQLGIEASPTGAESEDKGMNRLNKAISNVAYILDSLTLLRQIQQTGDCNICKNRDCGYMPKVGQMVRYNCPFYKAESEEK